MFDAEKMVSLRHVYHKKCFTCRECERMMDAFIACDTPDGEQEQETFHILLDTNYPL